MATLTIQYGSKNCIPSCLPSETELQAGEQVKVPLKPKNPLWPSYLKAHLAQPAFQKGGRRIYLLDFDDSQLNGGPTPDKCDIGEVSCLSCCDVNAERLENLLTTLVNAGLISENEDGTFNYLA